MINYNKNWQGRKISSFLLTFIFVVVLTTGANVFVRSANAANIGFRIDQTFNSLGDSITATWLPDPGATIGVSSGGTDIWNIDLTSSGHTTPGGDFLFAVNSYVGSWVDVSTPGTYNDLYFINPFQWQLRTNQSTPANPNFDGIYGVFGNGVSIYAGDDYNSDSVFISVRGTQVADPVPEPATMLLLGSGLVGLAGFGRKKFQK